MTSEHAHLLGVFLTMPGNPSGARINAARRATVTRTKTGKIVASTVSSRGARSWSKVARLQFRSQWRGVSDQPLEGPVSLEIRTYWPRLRRSGPAKGQPLGDVDACVKAVLDALERAGVLADDAQVQRLTLVNGYDRENPRIEVVL